MEAQKAKYSEALHLLSRAKGIAQGPNVCTRIALEPSKFTHFFARLLGSASQIYKLWIGSFPPARSSHRKTQKKKCVTFLTFLSYCDLRLFWVVLFYSLRNQFTGDASFYPPLRKKGRSERSVTLHRLIVMPENSIEVGTQNSWLVQLQMGRCWCLAITFSGVCFRLFEVIVVPELF